MSTVSEGESTRSISLQELPNILIGLKAGGEAMNKEKQRFAQNIFNMGRDLNLDMESLKIDLILPKDKKTWDSYEELMRNNPDIKEKIAKSILKSNEFKLIVNSYNEVKAIYDKNPSTFAQFEEVKEALDKFGEFIKRLQEGPKKPKLEEIVFMSQIIKSSLLSPSMQAVFRAVGVPLSLNSWAWLKFDKNALKKKIKVIFPQVEIIEGGQFNIATKSHPASPTESPRQWARIQIQRDVDLKLNKSEYFCSVEESGKRYLYISLGSLTERVQEKMLEDHKKERDIQEAAFKERGIKEIINAAIGEKKEWEEIREENEVNYKKDGQVQRLRLRLSKEEATKLYNKLFEILPENFKNKISIDEKDESGVEAQDLKENEVFLNVGIAVVEYLRDHKLSLEPIKETKKEKEKPVKSKPIPDKREDPVTKKLPGSRVVETPKPKPLPKPDEPFKDRLSSLDDKANKAKQQSKANRKDSSTDGEKSPVVFSDPSKSASVNSKNIVSKEEFNKLQEKINSSINKEGQKVTVHHTAEQTVLFKSNHPKPLCEAAMMLPEVHRPLGFDLTAKTSEAAIAVIKEAKLKNLKIVNVKVGDEKMSLEEFVTKHSSDFTPKVEDRKTDVDKSRP